MVTATDITTALGRDLSLRFRFERRTQSYDFLEDVSRAFPSDRTQSMDLDNNRATLRTARFTIDPTLATIDPINDCIAVRMEALIDGEWEEFPMGLFRLVIPDDEYNPNTQRKWNVQAADLSSVLIDNSPSAPLRVQSGTNYLSAVAAILTSLGLSSDLPSTTYTAPVDFTWAQSTPWLTIINDLLWAINFYPIAPNATGVFTTRERVDPVTWSPAVHYQTGQMVVPPFNRKPDRTKYANRITVKIEDPSRTPASATRNNNDSNSSISQATTGQIALKSLAGGRVYDATVAAEIAAYELRDRANRVTQATLRTALDPRRGANETYRLTIDSVESGSLWQVQGWKVELKAGAIMEHQIQKVLSIAVVA